MSNLGPTGIAQPPEPIGIVVAVGDEALRERLARWLRTDGRFAVLGEEGTAAAALTTVVEALPDVVFVDLDLPPGPAHADSADDPPDGVAVMAAVKETAPAVRMVAVTDEDDDRAYAALAAGAMGCYLWNDPASSAADMAAGAARGEGALTAGWAGRILDEVRWLAREPGMVPAPELGPTELEVLRRIAAGATPSDIAELHGVTTHVVNVHAGVAITRVWRHHDDARRLAPLPDPPEG